MKIYQVTVEIAAPPFVLSKTLTFDNTETLMAFVEKANQSGFIKVKGRKSFFAFPTAESAMADCETERHNAQSLID